MFFLYDNEYQLLIFFKQSICDHLYLLNASNETWRYLNKNDLMKFRNFGKKSLTELDELVAAKGLNFGMDLGKYKLDKE